MGADLYRYRSAPKGILENGCLESCRVKAEKRESNLPFAFMRLTFYASAHLAEY